MNYYYVEITDYDKDDEVSYEVWENIDGKFHLVERTSTREEADRLVQRYTLHYNTIVNLILENQQSGLQGPQGEMGPPGVPAPDNIDKIKRLEERIDKLELIIETGISGSDLDLLDYIEDRFGD